MLERKEVEIDLFCNSCDTMSTASLQELENIILYRVIDVSAAVTSHGDDEFDGVGDDRFFNSLLFIIPVKFILEVLLCRVVFHRW